jgi:hypothetical protein
MLSPDGPAAALDAGGGEDRAGSLRRAGAGQHEIDAARIALRADKPLGPIQNRGFGVVAAGVLGRVGLDLMPVVFAPDDEPDMGAGRRAQRHRRPAVALHPRALAPGLKNLTQSPACVNRRKQKDGFRNRQRPLSLGGGNRSSCPTAVARAGELDPVAHHNA